MRRASVALAIVASILATWAIATPAQARGCTRTIRPGASISDALDSLRPGAVLCLHGGTYRERVNAHVAGKAGSRIVVRAVHGERPVVVGLFWVTARYVTFSHINVTWDPNNSHSEQMVKLRGGRNWIWQRSEVWGAQSHANILVSRSGSGAPPVNWAIRRSCVHDAIGSADHSPTEDHNIYVSDIAGSTGGRIVRNVIFNATHGRNIKLGPPDGSGGPTNVKIRWNTIYRGGRGIIVGADTSGTVIAHNLIVRSTDGDLITGYHLTGSGNVARDNGGWASESGRLIGGSGIKRDGGNVWVNPHFSSVGCSGFRTKVDYGRWGR